MKISRDLLPATAQRRIRRALRPAFFGSLRRTTPLSRSWGFDRGTPIDRYYIERFLGERQDDIRGRVLEVKDNAYTNRFGTAVSDCQVIDIDAANPHATIVADLTAADHVPSNQFDCFILTQTLHLIYDTRSAIRHAYRILRPGGVLLVTVPTLSRSSKSAPGDYWRFTPDSCVSLFAEVFGGDNVRVTAPGNVLVSVAFLEGIAYEELKPRELEHDDAEFPIIVTVRAQKPLERAAA